MGFRLIAFEATSAVTAYTATTALADDSITKIDSTHYKVPSQNLLLGAYGNGLHLSRYQIKTPSLSNNRVPIEVDEIDPTDDKVISTVPPFMDWSDSPPRLIAGEALEVDNLTDATSDAVAFGVWLGDGQISYVNGTYLPGVRATSSTTLVAYTWTNCTLTFDNQLPAGAYAVVGMKATSATGLLARLAFPELGPRPGVIAGTQPTQAYPDFRNGRFRSGARGQFVSWGSFVSDSPPSADFMAVTTDSAEVVELDLVKIA